MSVWYALAPWQLGIIGLLFVWSGFVRSGLGFGGAALTLPMLLLVVNNPILFLPAICWHLLLFSMLTIATRLDNVDWRFVAKLSGLLALPFAAGLAGLLNLPGSVLTLFVYAVTLFYAFMYIAGRSMRSGSATTDAALLIVGGYASGVSLTGAPLIAAVGARQLPPARVRDTLFVVWIVLVIAKLATFIAADVDLQWQLAALTLPAVAIGHVAGLRVHEHIVAGGRRGFERLVGLGLATVSTVGLVTVASRLLRAA